MTAHKESFPHGMNNAFLFALFNALSFQIVLSSPMVLYAKSLGASATILGVIVGMMPLLVIFQIPAAYYVHRVGYKRFVYGGWGMRVMFIFGMAVVPLLGGILDANNLLALMLMLLFCFNLSRGISSCAWLPWITALVPGSLRGKFLVREAGFANLASFVTFLVAALCLGQQPRRRNLRCSSHLAVGWVCAVWSSSNAFRMSPHRRKSAPQPLACHGPR